MTTLILAAHPALRPDDPLDAWSHTISPFRARQLPDGGAEVLMGAAVVARLFADGEPSVSPAVPDNLRARVLGLIDQVRAAAGRSSRAASAALAVLSIGSSLS